MVSPRRVLADFRQLDGLLDRQAPGMVKVQVGKLRGQEFGLGQPGVFVRRRVLGDAAGGGDGFLDGLGAKIRAAGRAFALAEIDGHAQALAAVVFDSLHLAQAHIDGKPLVHAQARLRRAGPLPLRLGENVGDQAFKPRQLLGFLVCVGRMGHCLPRCRVRKESANCTATARRRAGFLRFPPYP